MDEVVWNLLVTTEDQEEFISIIDQLLSLVYTDENSILSFLHSEIPERFSNFFVNHLQTTLDRESKERFLKQLRDQASRIEKLDLTIAFHPSRNALERIVSTVRKQYGSNTLIQVHYKPEIIAGAEIVYKGIYRDVTSRGRLDEVLASLKGKLA